MTIATGRRGGVLIGLAVAVCGGLGLSSATARADVPAPVTSIPCTGNPNSVTPFTVIVPGQSVYGQTAYGLYALPSGPPRGLVVTAHGYGHTVESWRKHLTDIATRDGVIALAMDYRGQIDSPFFPPPQAPPLPSSRGWQVSEGAADSIAAAQMVNSSCPGLGTSVIFGVSMGGNTSGLVAASRATRPDGRPLFDYWFDVEGATNVTETYAEASSLAASGNAFATDAKADIEREMGGTPTAAPGTYAQRTVVTRAPDMKASHVLGVVVVHGQIDGLVPSNQSDEMVAALQKVGIPTDYFSIGTRPTSSEPGTTIDGTVIGALPPPGLPYTSPFAGHASEASDTHIVLNTAFDRLDALYNNGAVPQGLRVTVAYYTP
jgi:acetyl esterase/lipase